ncbi:DUF397 domain-containing protein [Streptomyces sp. NPDC048248]|uniref:DUF397 domain-containing protein n=1 Tax=Streptomyces sp. NPDC048248 TaxID=3365523 RepID=UPI00370F7A73
MTETPNWHTSTYTKSDNCVEVADNDPAEVKVRDSNRPGDAVLAFPQVAWDEFLDFVRR